MSATISNKVIFQLVLFSLSIFGAIVLTNGTAKAACSVDTSRGVVTQTFTVPSDQAGAYRAWSRMGATTAGSDSYYLEIDGGTCISVGGANIPTSGWKWVDYKDGNENNKTSGIQLTAGNHSIKMIGAEDGVKLDKILFVRSDSCVPTDKDGNPCLPDTVPPTNVVVSAPASPLSGTSVQLSATASDNDAIEKVTFRLNGTELQPADSASPYNYALDTTKFTNGTYQLTAVARDKSGNETSSPAVNITINNPVPDTTDPTVSITLPLNNSSVPAGVITVNANATDNVGVTKVEFYVDNATTPAATDTSAPYSSGSSINLTSGSHSVKAKAYDAAGRSATATVNFSIVQNTGLKCDFDKDGKVSFSDLTILGFNFRKNVTIGTNGDCENNDGYVNGFDLTRLVYELR